eukprot:COSAG04_NODE_618_length_11896_cov_81.925659_14_plen_147_part_00
MRAFAGSLRENEQLVRERIAQQSQARPSPRPYICPAVRIDTAISILFDGHVAFVGHGLRTLLIDHLADPGRSAQARQDRQRRAGALPPAQPDRDEATKMVVVDMWGRPWSPHRGMVCATPNDGSKASAGGKGRKGRRPASAGAHRS